MKVSLVISTYNWPEALKCCLESVVAQKVLPFEVVIADDGSGQATANVVNAFRERLNIVHVWQPDEGFQLATIRNKAFAKAQGEYIIQVDGDLVLHPSFVADHISFCKKGAFVSGGRCLMDPELNARFFAGKIMSQSLHWYSSALKKRYNAFRCKPLASFNYLISVGKDAPKYALGCNMAFWKEDILKVNGYNEDFKGWGKEDNDLSVRLCNAGIRMRFVKFAAVVFHLYHVESPRPGILTNELIFSESRGKRITYITNGIDKYIL